ncbi:MAG: ATP-grasp domain-containing protein [bacterium]|nr:ATP-grasp domain-containing protein [Acidimicrobiia bacterium]MCY4651340.1 ATP-grasp domain-containing protein [bacterium]
MPHVLLIIPTQTYRATDFITAADALGIELSVASEEELPLVATDRQVRIDCTRPEWSAQVMADHAARMPIDSIVPLDDQGVVMAARAAHLIGLPHNPPDGAAATRNKVMMRRRLAQDEISQPRFTVMESGDSPAGVASQMGLPVVFKPLSRSGGQGVIRVNKATDADRAVRRIRRILASAGENPNQPILVEEFLPGGEVAVEGLLSAGRLEILTVFDKPGAPQGPYFEETILIAPSQLPSMVLAEVEHLTRRAVLALGLKEGPIHAELRIGSDRVSVLEVAARSIGGLCSRSLRFGLMADSWESLILRQALGIEIPSTVRQPAATGVMMLPIPRSGRLVGVEGTDEARQTPGIVDLEITIPVGGRIMALPDGDRYLGFLFAAAARRAHVERALREAFSRLQIIIE